MATVLISAPTYLPTLTARPQLKDALAFAEGDVLQALEAITTGRPDVVVLEKQFADTSRGTALINRIKADPTLKHCDIQVVLHDGGTESVVREPEPVVTLAPDTTSLSPLDYRGTRRADRFNIQRGIEVQIEGNPVQLVNMSAVGVQVISSGILRPNQKIRLSLNSQPGAARYKSVVAWATFELPQGVARYRAGIEILDHTDQSALTKFIKKHKV
ncbi:MAG: hypothetical protein HOP16_09645 [Acidobacteria bacterium]|nr:hypothetical protein [Acidobacteriota bacterium]